MFNIKGDMKPITKHLTKLQKKQIPFAAANAINTTLFQILKKEKQRIAKRLDRPTDFTSKAFKVNKAKKHQLWGSVEIQPDRWKYLKYQVEGGTRTKNIVVPTQHSKLNKFGNIVGKKKGGSLYSGNKKFVNKTGVWLKTGGKRNPKIKLIAAFRRSATYRKRFPFRKIADGVARSRFKKNLQRSIKHAIATAR